MGSKERIRILRRIVTELYYQTRSIQRVVDDCGIELDQMTFVGTLTDVWYEILKKAEEQNRIDALIKIAHEEFPHNPKLLQLLESNKFEISKDESKAELSTKDHGAALNQLALWDKLQLEGDHYYNLALRATLSQDSYRHLQTARDKYLQALGGLSDEAILSKITLYRKVATILRKLGDIPSAKSRYLDEGQKILEEISEQPKDATLYTIEEAFYRLEYAYCNFDEQNWDELKYQVKELTKKFERERYRRLHSDIHYVLGCAYNLLAIAIAQSGKSESNTSTESSVHWDTAREYLLRVNDSKSRDVLRSIELNRAVRQFDHGDYDLSIPTLKTIISDEAATVKQRIKAEQTLAAVYLDRLGRDDITNAYAIALKNLDRAKRLREVREWVYALHLYLEVLKVSLIVKYEVKLAIENAQREYGMFTQFAQLKHTDPNEVEIRRLLAEIYLASDNLESAELEIHFINTNRQKDDDREEGDNYLTLARYHFKRGEFSESLVHLKEARLCYLRAQHHGKVIEVDWQWVDIEICQGNLSAATQRLEDTLTIANGLSGQTRIDRIAEKLKSVQKSLVTPAIMSSSFVTPLVKVLFLASNPSNLTHLRSAEEFREIEEQLKLAKLRERFEVNSKMSSRAKDISLALLEMQPQIVHFSGHGAENGGIYLENLSGEAQLTSPNALAELFRQFSTTVNCVILNACYSELQAEAIAQYIPYVIGVSHLINDRDAIAFSIGFYQALGAGRSIEQAYYLGRIQINLSCYYQDSHPVLLLQKATIL